MRYSRALFAAALALSAAACGQSVSAPEPASGGVAPTAPSYDGGVGWGGGQRADSSDIASTNSTTPGDSTTAIGENRGNYFGSGN
jgi:hypothetical protein